MFVWAFKQYDAKIYHGSNTIWNKYCSKQGKLTKGHRDDGIKLRPGTAVFLLNSTGRHHIGLYVGDNTVIEAKGTKWGVVTSKPSHWDEWGELKDVDYSMCPEEQDEEQYMPTLSKGDVGASVKTLQRMLNDLGYNCGAIDGKFGSKTEAAVKAFQEANGLTPDGIVGDRTWAALGVNQPETPEEPKPSDPQITRAELVTIREYLKNALDLVEAILDE